MFPDFLSMMNNHEKRVVDNYDEKGDETGLVVDTCAVSDSDQPFETGIKDPRYNNDEWIIVEMYDSKEEAQTGHDKWVKLMTEAPPNQLKDVSTAEVKKLCEAMGCEFPASERG